MSYYCRENSFCVNENCRQLHYKSFFKRQVIAKIMKANKDEIDKYMEPIDPKIWRNCQQHMLCVHDAKDCNNNHGGYALDARKIIIKEFEEMEKNTQEIQQ